MDITLVPFTMVVFLMIYEIRNYMLLRSSTFLYEEYGIKFYEHNKIRDDDNAVAIVSIFFKDSIIFYGKVNDNVVYHELGHLKQKKEIYLFLIIFPTIFTIAFSFNPLLIITLIPLYKLFFVHLERKADLYAFTIYNMMYIAQKTERPLSRLKRLKEWIFDSHPPDWIRTRKEYYDRRKNSICLFIEDIFY